MDYENVSVSIDYDHFCKILVVLGARYLYKLRLQNQSLSSVRA